VPAPSTLALFALAALALIAIPGPNMLFVATRSMSEGRRSGLASALGLETGTIIHVCAAAAGLSALIASSATAFNALRYLGAAYLVYLGIRALRQRPTTAEGGAPTPVSLSRAYRQAIVVQLLNPKVALFFLAFLPQFVAPHASSRVTAFLFLGAVFVFNGTLWCLVLVMAASALSGRLRRNAAGARRLRQATGAVFVGLGARLALSK